VLGAAALAAAVAIGCGGPDPAAGYRTTGAALAGDADGDGRRDRVTLRVDARRPPRCRHLLVVETGTGAVTVAPVRPLPWPGTDPRLRLLAEIDGRPGLEPVVALTSRAAVYRPGAVFTMRDGAPVRMGLAGRRPAGLFPFSDEFPSGVDCAGRRGRIVVTFGTLARDDRYFDLRRSVYRAAGTRFERVRTRRFRVSAGPEAKRRWPELRGDPFRTCAGRVSA
jgi:hypothetical protein